MSSPTNYQGRSVMLTYNLEAFAWSDLLRGWGSCCWCSLFADIGDAASYWGYQLLYIFPPCVYSKCFPPLQWRGQKIYKIYIHVLPLLCCADFCHLQCCRCNNKNIRIYYLCLLHVTESLCRLLHTLLVYIVAIKPNIQWLWSLCESHLHPWIKTDQGKEDEGYEEG